MSSTRVRGLRVGPSARRVPAQPNRRRAPTSGIRGVDHTTSHRVPRSPASKGTIRNLARWTSRPGRFHHAEFQIFPLSSRRLPPPVPDSLRRGSRVPTFSDVPGLHGKGRCARGPVATSRARNDVSCPFRRRNGLTVSARIGFCRARSSARGRLFLGVPPYGFFLNCRRARLAYFSWHVVRCPHSTPLSRLPGADEVRQGDPAAGSPAGAFRFPLYPLQSGGNHYAGSVCLVRHGLAEAQRGRRSVVGNRRRRRQIPDMPG